MNTGKPGGTLIALSDAVLAISAERDLDAVLQTIVDRARDLVGARYAAIGVPGQDRERLDHFTVSGLAPEQIRGIGQMSGEHGILEAMRRTGESVRLADGGSEPSAVGTPPYHPPLRSFLGVPIRAAGVVLGEVYLADKLGETSFSEDDQELVEVLARHAALAITNARLVQRLAESEERYRLLTEGAPELVFALDRVGRISFINGRVREITGAERERFLGHLLREMVSPEHRAVVDIHLRAMRGGAARTSFEVSAADVHGELHHFEISLVPAGGPGAGFQGVGRDVTEKRSLTRQITERTSELLSTDKERQRLREFVSLVIQAQEDERARIAGDLHDTTVQTLTAIGRRLHSLAANGAPGTDTLKDELTELAEAAMTEGEEVRRLSRNLRPSALDHLGLAAGLEHLARELRDEGLRVALVVDGNAGQLDDQQRTALFRIAQEALRNVRRHSDCTRVDVQLAVGPAEVSLLVADNGCGFDVEQDRDEPDAGSARLGLQGMRERAAILGGWLTIDSQPGAGTRVGARLPLVR